MSSIVLQPGVKDMLLADCKDFLCSEEWYVNFIYRLLLLLTLLLNPGTQSEVINIFTGLVFNGTLIPFYFRRHSFQERLFVARCSWKVSHNHYEELRS